MLVFHTLDVFASKPLTGNPLAVVLDADLLDVSRMQAIAREFNLSETAFVGSPRDPIHCAKVRIFTPTAELPFAGHPTLGTAALLAELQADDILRSRPVGLVLEEAIGDISCTVRRAGDGGLRASFDLPRLPQRGPNAPSVAHLAEALSLRVDDIGFDSRTPTIWSAGTPFIFTPIASRAAIEAAAPAPAAWSALGAPGARNVFLYTKETSDPRHHLHVRVFAPDLGILEDPATGSAAAAFAGAALEGEPAEDGEHSLFIEQGEEMGRPSLIALDLRIEGGLLTHVAVGGAAVRVSEGRLRL